MSGVRRLYLDRSPGEARGVVALDGRPERLLIERADDSGRPRLGERWRGRVGRRAGLAGGAFLDLGFGPDAVMKGGRELPEGSGVEVEIVGEARAGKGPTAAFRKLSPGAPGRLAVLPPIEARLQVFAPDAEIIEAAAAREAADLAEESALELSHRIGLGGILTIESTRALVAIDVDLAQAADRGGSPEQLNRRAVEESARLLRLKGFGGIVVIDLIGRPRDASALVELAKNAFQPDQPGVVFTPIGRFGTLELARPHRETPVVERLCDPDGRPSVQTMALRLARRLEAEGRAAPGARLRALAPSDVALAFTSLESAVAGLLGPRFTVVGEAGRPREAIEVMIW